MALLRPARCSEALRFALSRSHQRSPRPQAAAFDDLADVSPGELAVQNAWMRGSVVAADRQSTRAWGADHQPTDPVKFDRDALRVLLPAAVKRGGPSPEESLYAVKENPYWEELVPAIAPMSFPVAQFAATKLGLATRGPMSILDIGGGSGVFSAVFLGANKEARTTQLDWANVNRIARGFVGNFGVGDRFATIDGDFHSADLGSGYDLVVYSHMAHGESPRSNTEVFKRVRAALKPGGTFLIQEFVLNDDRTSDGPFALFFHSIMLLGTAEGSAWRKADYRSWLAEAGFTDVVIERLPVGPATLIYAK